MIAICSTNAVAFKSTRQVDQNLWRLPENIVFQGKREAKSQRKSAKHWEKGWHVSEMCISRCHFLHLRPARRKLAAQKNRCRIEIILK